MVKYFARYGIPGLALFVLLVILSRFDFQLAEISKNFAATIAIITVVGVLIVAILVLVLHHKRESNESSVSSEAILLKYNQLVTGLPSPKQNIWAIEDIANSEHPQKQHFLRELQKSSTLSYIEQDAIALALANLASRKVTKDAYDRLHKKESDRWQRDVVSDGQVDMTWMALWGLKIWRYLNRKDHRQYRAVEEALARVSINRELDEETLRLFNSLEIMGG